jgi:riboflavin biosynthesis pyrimidine reductase
VLDRKHRLPATSKLIQSKDTSPLWVLDSPTVESAIEKLTKKGITRLLVEAGQGLNTAFINSGLVDSIYWFKAPFTIGENGLDAFVDRKTLPEAWTKHPNRLSFPPDNLEIYERMDSSQILHSGRNNA